MTSRIVPWRGIVTDIHVAPTGGEPMVATERVTAVAGRGLMGDRYHDETGFYSWFKGPLRHVSLIESEVLDTLRDFHDLPLEPGTTRRNIVTRGVPLGHLLGREFRVGEATLRGVEICEPCKHLVDLTGNRSLLSALIHRGGLHAEVVRSGEIRVGDTVEAILSDPKLTSNLRTPGRAGRPGSLHPSHHSQPVTMMTRRCARRGACRSREAMT